MQQIKCPAKPHGLTPKREMFCHYIAGGANQTSAYKSAFGTRPGSNHVAPAASNLMKRDDIRSRVADLREYHQLSNALTKAEKRDFLANMVRTPIGEIDETSPLAKEVTYEETIAKNGTRTLIKKVKAHDKLAALAEDSKLAGHYFADQPENRQNPFAFIVAFADRTALGAVEKKISGLEIEP